MPKGIYKRRDHCKRGHPFDDENTRWVNDPRGKWRSCRTCARASTLRYNDKNKDKRRKYLTSVRGKEKVRAWKRRYNVPIYRQFFEEQGGVCAICKQPESRKINGRVTRLCLDHCHKTEVVRGLLCYSCNSALGHFGDNPERLRQAATYIEESR